MKKIIKYKFIAVICVFAFVLASCDEKDFGPIEPENLIIQGPTSVSLGQTRQYSTYYLEDGNYAWTVPAGATVDSGQGKSQVMVTFGSVGGDVSVSAKGGRNATLSVTVE